MLSGTKPMKAQTWKAQRPRRERKRQAIERRQARQARETERRYWLNPNREGNHATI